MSGFRLGVRCCFCGGVLDLDEACRTVRCAHCASMLKVWRPDGLARYALRDELQPREVKFLIDRHLKEADRPLVKRWRAVTRNFVPFWRVTGTIFSVTEKAGAGGFESSPGWVEQETARSRTDVRIRGREISLCANTEFPWEPATLGVRPQVLRLEPVDDEFVHEHVIVPLTVTQAAARERFERAASGSVGGGGSAGAKLLTTAVGVELSVIYFPIWIASFSDGSGERQAQLDPLAKRVVSLADEIAELPQSDDSEHPGDWGAVSTSPHRCPNCGADLPDRDRSVVHFCGNCRRLYADAGRDYRQIELNIPAAAEPEHMLFPFWLFDLGAVNTDHREPLDKALALLRMDGSRFIVPAFEITDPARILRLLSQYNSGRQFRPNPTTVERLGSLIDAVHTQEAAAEMIVPLIGAAKASKGYRSYEAPLDAPIQFPESQLVWMPYVAGDYFWRDALTGATIEKAAVAG